VTRQQWPCKVSTNDAVPLAATQPQHDGGTGDGDATAAPAVAAAAM